MRFDSNSFFPNKSPVYIKFERIPTKLSRKRCRLTISSSPKKNNCLAFSFVFCKTFVISKDAATVHRFVILFATDKILCLNNSSCLSSYNGNMDKSEIHPVALSCDSISSNPARSAVIEKRGKVVIRLSFILEILSSPSTYPDDDISVPIPMVFCVWLSYITIQWYHLPQFNEHYH